MLETHSLTAFSESLVGARRCGLGHGEKNCVLLSSCVGYATPVGVASYRLYCDRACRYRLYPSVWVEDQNDCCVSCGFCK